MTASIITNKLKMCFRFTNHCSLKLDYPISFHPRRKYTSSASSTGCEMLMITEHDREEILNFLYKTFIKYEPLNQALNVMETDDYRNTDVDNFNMRYNSCLSVKAVPPSGNIIGCCLNDAMKRGEVEKETSPHPKMQKIAGLLNEVAEKANIFGKYPDVDKLLYMHISSVDPSWADKGIGGKLLLSSLDVGRKNGFKMVAGHCTSMYSARAAIKQGFERIYALKYEDYKVNGEVVFQPQKPHTEIGVYVKKLD